MAEEITVAAPAPAVESVAPAPTPESAQPQPDSSLLGTTETKEAPVEKAVEQPKAEEAKVTEPPKEQPKDTKPETAEKKEEASQSVEPAPLPTYEPFTLPEGMHADQAKLDHFTKALADFEISSKADHAEVQKLGQELVGRHVAEVQDIIKRRDEAYVAAWNKQKSDWKESFVKDPEIGGNRQQTTLNSALEFIRTHGGNDAQQKDFRDLMDSTGVGNHPAMIRLMANAMQAMREGKPIPASKPASDPRSKVKTRYGTN